MRDEPTETEQRYHAEMAWLGGPSPARNVLISTEGGRISGVSVGAQRPTDAHRLGGLTLPGLVNSHSHVFHRALRGATQEGRGDFWTWRDLMYRVAAGITPDTMYELARGTFAEMLLSGVTTVGEFHYLHHSGSGATYSDPNAMGHSLMAAAHDVGIRMTLLDTCYLQGDVSGSPLAGAQVRFGDGNPEGWMMRVEALRPTDLVRVGAAIHSIRAVPRNALRPIADFAAAHRHPLHLHLSEQIAENSECHQQFGMSPTEVMAAEGVLGDDTSVVHATHLSEADIAILGNSSATVVMCPSTERDLADGIGPAFELSRAGTPLAVGSDGHSLIDLWQDTRAIELDQRVITGTRGLFKATELLRIATGHGAASLGWDAGRIEPGALADLVAVSLDSPRTAGARSSDVLAGVIYSASSADVTDVVVGGRLVVESAHHRLVPDVGPTLAAAVAAVIDT